MQLENLHGLLLAAGESARFDGIKQHARFRGQSLLRRAAGTATAVLGKKVHVVLGANAGQLRVELAGLDLQIAINERWRDGLGSSLRAGIGALPADCDAALVMLCDQPLVDGGTLHRLIAAHAREPHRLVASEYAGTLGVPTIIPRAFFAECAAATGEQGAKPLLDRYREHVIRVPAPEAAVDIDTRNDLAALTGPV